MTATATAARVISVRQSLTHLLQDSRLTSIEIIGVWANAIGSSESWKLLFAIKPETRLVNYTFSEIAGHKWDKSFSLPLPWRYGIITVDANHSLNRAMSHVTGKFPNLMYAPRKLHGKRIMKGDELVHMGSFLSNSYPWDQRGTVFCQAYYYSASYSTANPFDESSIATAMDKILENYYWSQYNNHWYQQCFPSPSIYVLLRDLCGDVTFNSTAFSELQKLAKDTDYRTKTEYLGSPYWNYARNYNGITNNATEQIVYDYYKILTQLEANPNYWTEMEDRQIPSAVVYDATAYFSGIVQRGSKSKDEFINAVVGQK